MSALGINPMNIETHIQRRKVKGKAITDKPWLVTGKLDFQSLQNIDVWKYYVMLQCMRRLPTPKRIPLMHHKNRNKKGNNSFHELKVKGKPGKVK